ncbi:hypothetical protein BOX15_Mlig021455g1, partial [Macrostomum lignano]
EDTTAPVDPARRSCLLAWIGQLLSGTVSPSAGKGNRPPTESDLADGRLLRDLCVSLGCCAAPAPQTAAIDTPMARFAAIEEFLDAFYRVRIVELVNWECLMAQDSGFELQALRLCLLLLGAWLQTGSSQARVAAAADRLGAASQRTVMSLTRQLLDTEDGCLSLDQLRALHTDSTADDEDHPGAAAEKSSASPQLARVLFPSAASAAAAAAAAAGSTGGSLDAATAATCSPLKLHLAASPLVRRRCRQRNSVAGSVSMSTSAAATWTASTAESEAIQQLNHRLQSEMTMKDMLEQQLLDAQNQLARRERDCSDLEDRLRRSRSELGHQSNELAELREENRRLAEQAEQLGHVTESLQEMSRYADRYSYLEQEFDRLMHEREAMKATLERLQANRQGSCTRREAEEHVGHLTDELMRANSEINRLLQAKKEAQDSAEAAERRCAEMRQQLAEMSSRLDDSAMAAAAEPDSAETLFGVTEKKIYYLEQELEAARADAAKVREERNKLDADLGIARMEMLQIRLEADATSKEALEEAEKIKQAAENAAADREAAAKKSVASIESTMNNLRKELASKELQLDAAQLEASAANDRVADLQAEADRLRELASKLEAETAAKDAALTEMKNRTTSVERLEKQFERTKTLIEQMQEAYKFVESQLDSANERVKELQTELLMQAEEHKTALASVKAELANSRKNFETRERELDEVKRCLEQDRDQLAAELAHTVEELQLARQAGSQEAHDTRERCAAAMEDADRRQAEARAEFESALNEKRQFAEGLRAARDQALAELADLKAAYDAAVKANQRKVADLHEQLEAQQVIAADTQLRLEGELTNIQCELDNAKERICQLEADAATAAATAAAAVESEPEPSAELLDSRRLAENLERRCKDLQEELRLMRDSLSEKDKRLAEREALLDTATEEKARVDAEIVKARQAAEQASESIAMERDRAQRKVEGLQRRLADCEDELLSRDAEIDRLSNRLALAASQQDELQRESARLRRELATTSDRLQAESEAANKLRELRTKSELELAELQDQLQELQYRSNRQRSGAELRASAAAREEVQREVKAVTDRLTKELEAAEEELKASKAEAHKLRSNLHQVELEQASLVEACQRRKAALKKAIEERNEEAEMKERLLVRCQELEEAANIRSAQQRRNGGVVESPEPADEQRQLPTTPPLQSNRVHQLVRANSDVNMAASPVFDRRPFALSTSNNASNNGCSAAAGGAGGGGGGGKGGQLSCEDEDAHLLEWKRIAELQQRNQRQPAQLRSSYPVETQTASVTPRSIVETTASSAVASRSTSTIATSALTSTLASTWSSTSAAVLSDRNRLSAGGIQQQQQQQQQPPPPPQRQRLFKSPKSAAPRLALTTSAAASTRPKNTSASMSTLQQQQPQQHQRWPSGGSERENRSSHAIGQQQHNNSSLSASSSSAEPVVPAKKTLVYSIEMNPGRPGPRRPAGGGSGSSSSSSAKTVRKLVMGD